MRSWYLPQSEVRMSYIAHTTVLHVNDAHFGTDKDLPAFVNIYMTEFSGSVACTAHSESGLQLWYHICAADPLPFLEPCLHQWLHDTWNPAGDKSW